MQFALFLEYSINAMMRNIWAVTLLKDLCPFITFASVPVLISNKHTYFKMVMPWLAIGSLTTMLTGGSAFHESFWAGIHNYGAHILMLIQSIFIYLVVDKYSRQDLWRILLFPALLIIWVLLVGLLPWKLTGDPNWAIYSTALLEPAATIYEYGGYHFQGAFSVLGSFGLPYPLPTFIFYALTVLIAYAIVLNKKYFPLYSKVINKWIKENIFAKVSKNKQK